jgi:hypothetical protein
LKARELPAQQEENPESRQQNAVAATKRLIVPDTVDMDIQEYLSKAGSSLAARYWALAIAKDGSRVESASCPKSFNGGAAMFCNANATSVPIQEFANREALKRCGRSECVLLYVGKNKVANLDIVLP